MSEHTPEPWSFEQDMRGDGVPDDCYTIFGDPETECIARVFTKEDARRIVACVNACKNIPIETLEDGGVEFALAKADERAEEAGRLLRNLVEADETVVTASYCEYCDSHADKNDDGQLTAPVLHSIGCPMKEARAFLDRRPE